jgi:hypothetical protein
VDPQLPGPDQGRAPDASPQRRRSDHHLIHELRLVTERLISNRPWGLLVNTDSMRIELDSIWFGNGAWPVERIISPSRGRY